MVWFFGHDAWYNFDLTCLIQEKSFINRLCTKKELTGSPFPSSLDSFCKGTRSNTLLVLPLPCICLYALYGYTFSSSFSCKVWILICLWCFYLLMFVVTAMYMINDVWFLYYVLSTIFVPKSAKYDFLYFQCWVIFNICNGEFKLTFPVKKIW